MFGITAIHRVFALFAVRASGPLRRVSYQTSVLPVQVRAGTLVAASPTSESGNTIKFLPIGKSIVGGVVEHHPASVADIIQKTPLGRSAPAVSVIIQDHHPVGAKIGIKSIHIAALRRRNRPDRRQTVRNFADGLQRPVADGQLWLFCPVTINARIGLRAQDTPGKQTTHASSSAAFKIVFLYIRLTFR